ncbi:MAG: hypothetical protein IPK26_06145 [Planctomycetes bacterium]|nr:hypothetical protein [Planctomycetota bacterium]
MAARRKPPEFFDCPNCGEPVKVGSAACRECGSDARTGWQSGEEVDYQSVDVPDGWGPDDEAPTSGGANPWRWRIVALVLAIVLITYSLLGWW